MTAPLPCDVPDDDRLARLALSRLVEPGSWPLFAAVRQAGAVAVWDALRRGRPVAGLSRALVAAAAARAAVHEPLEDVRALAACGGRLVVPSDEEWPAERLEWPDRVLDDAPPLALFVRGSLPLARTVDRSVAVVGARAATAYGVAVARDLSCGLADRGATVISGGAYGIDGAAHTGALASARSPTVAVLACGVDVSYPRGHDRLLARVAEQGLIVSEVGPGCPPTRARFLVRNRVIAALSLGTVVVEAALRSGSLSTAARADALSRERMAVPGPVTSAQSAGAHELLRTGATLVTSAAQVLQAVGRIGEDGLPPAPRGPVQARDALSETVRAVLDQVPVRGGIGEAGLARAAGVSTLVVQQVLPPLVVAGLVQRTDDGWRLTALGMGRPAR
jgi:DNA processing protein